jgi:hypothetical protein
MNLKVLARYAFCCLLLALYAACDPFSFTDFNFENSLNEEVTVQMVYSVQSPIQGDTTFTIAPNSRVLFQQMEERGSRATLGFNSLGDLFDSITVIRANGDRSSEFTNESEWDMKTEGSDTSYCLVIDETDF